MPQSMSESSSLIPRMYKTLLQRRKTSPRLPRKLPSTHSSVLSNWRFMYESIDFKVPLYSIPHFSFTSTNLPVRSLRNGFGFTGTVAIAHRDQTLLPNNDARLE